MEHDCTALGSTVLRRTEQSIRQADAYRAETLADSPFLGSLPDRLCGFYRSGYRREFQTVG
ncbi:hypothetical protein [Bacteroides sp. An322]|uniref:hypothetical protein n=1 Tax=Bacteroides sp. An322 TaxID=1965632 RepID=UPI0013A606DC|nr:hypothetical protein [Bacteroides sp. An322]